MTTGADGAMLLAALEGLAEHVRSVALPLHVADLDAACRLRREITDQLDDYLLPRLRRLDAPMLAVVGGPTGAGKSTLINSLVGQRISAAGVLRPTTRSAVLAYHPLSAAWFESRRILPGLGRMTGASSDPANLQLVASSNMPAGIAILDAPDIDSVVVANRELAAQLLSAADMWLFVTSAARYADAVPWEFLRDAESRGTAVAIVLDRVAPEAVDEVRAHLATMLTEQRLGGAPLFVVPETTPVDSMLPLGSVDVIYQWLQGLSSDPAVRATVVHHTLNGALRALTGRVVELAAASDAQAEAAARLRREVDQAYDDAVARVDRATGDGSLLRGEVLARWQEFVGAGEMMRALESKVGRLRDRVTAAGQRKSQPGDDLAEALESGVEAVVRAAADKAAERAGAAWRDDPAGSGLLGGGGGGGGGGGDGDGDGGGAADVYGGLQSSSPELSEAARQAVREWQDGVLELVRRQGQGKRTTARYLAFGVHGLGLLVMIAVFTQPGGAGAGDEAARAGEAAWADEASGAGSAAALSHKILAAAFGDQAVRSLASSARADLHRRVAHLLDGERRRFLARLDAVAISVDAGSALRAAVQDVEDTR